MQKGAYEEMEIIWPYTGFTVRASERKLGEGKLTLTEQSFLFEAKNREIVGFDFPALRLIRQMDSNTVELVYSIQSELRSASFRVVCTFPDGTERDDVPSKEDSYRMSLFRAITGGVIARFLADHSSAKTEGLTKMTDEKFEARMKDMERNLSLFPSKREVDEDVFRDESLRKRSLEAGEIEPKIREDPFRDRLYYMGTEPGMTVDNAFEKVDLLQEDWVNGKLSPQQRARCISAEYRIKLRCAEMGYEDEQGGSPTTWKESAERLIQFEKRLGIDILSLN